VVDGATDGKAARKVSILSELVKGIRRRGGEEGA
jgi:hypothetical protein